MKHLLVLGLLLLVACGKGSGTKTYPVKETELQKFINEKSLPKYPDLTGDKSIVDADYPIEIALYSDQRFYYNLPRLGDGKGTWNYKNGKIELKAKRTLFDMYIEVLGSDEESKTLTIKFTDRFGPNTIQMVNKNI